MKYGSVTTDSGNSFLSKLWYIAKYVLISYVITFLCLLVFAFIISYTDFSQEHIPLVVLLLTIFSVMLAGICSGRRGKNKGWASGAAAGLLYMLTLYILGCIVFKSVHIHAGTFAMLATGVFSGTFGGIVGVNLKKSR